ncbi:hypothetical protein, partial [uncultured Phocaeicola sp.]|uniref:hypothetical protein n=1 Tax=uncultured Phocaeicola sp. TaxID=990718 RepID=UPI0025A2E38E
PPAPKAGALTGLRYTPNLYFSVALFFKSDAKVRVIFISANFCASFLSCIFIVSFYMVEY